jgi:hypothetical protein
MVAEVTLGLKIASKKAARLIKEGGLPSGIDQGILKASKEAEKAGEDVADEDVQAAMLLAAIEKGGDPSKVTGADIETQMEKATVKETKQQLQESHSLGVQIVETGALILGNLALVEAICEVIEKITGKKIDASKFTKAVNTFAGWVKKATGWPMHAFGKAIEWVIKKLGGGESAQKIGKYSVKLVAVIAMAVMGIAFFPLGGVSLLGVALSITGMIGKGIEIGKLGYELFKAIGDAVGKGASKVVAKASANNPEMGMA